MSLYPPERTGMPERPHRIRPGVCSVTLRSQEPAEVIRIASEANLRAIEWGADIHVPPGNISLAREVRARTVDAGLAVASYGSYLRLGSSTEQEHEAVLNAAAALEAPRIRVWAGTRGSADTDDRAWEAVVEDARAFTDAAASSRVMVGLEFHAGTLTDTADSTAALLAHIDRGGLMGTYWQPPQGLTADDALTGLDLLADQVIAVHAFSWWPKDERHSLAARAHLWLAVLQRLNQRPSQTDVLLEFVNSDSPGQLVSDAGTLNGLLDQLSEDHRGQAVRAVAENP
ncbi:sugar phosphate isomerase/epimerase [Arthrobacter sp. M4]|uniref:sugar phosphate isomerase/epimerase family protein n=1 Tax=Arthrobacter sp. M4 TaxID=218160 RepID=UPI001CDC9A48|nr:TIM barrel protein [Arthrobacter sp. M4]MCA4132597.1 sugar phosphate isomerase/epimerase [Arthrobacter sp. M4]